MISGIAFVKAALPEAIGQGHVLPARIQKPDKAEQSGLSGFEDLFRDSVGKVENLEQQAQGAVEGLMRGTGIDVHEALIAAEKANAAFELTLSMRNKAVQAYQSIMSMQF